MQISKFLFGVEPEPVDRQDEEERTFDALRRIPFVVLEEKLPGIVKRNIDFNESVRVMEDDINSTDSIGMHTALDRSMLASLYGSTFEGTGWTTEEYSSVLYKRHRALKNQERKKKRLSRYYFALMLTLVFFVSQTFIAPLPLPWMLILSVLLGISGGSLHTYIKSKIDRTNSDEPF